MTYKEIIKRRIELKEQLILIERREIEALEKELKDLEPEPNPQPSGITKGKGKKV